MRYKPKAVFLIFLLLITRIISIFPTEPRRRIRGEVKIHKFLQADNGMCNWFSSFFISDVSKQMSRKRVSHKLTLAKKL